MMSVKNLMLNHQETFRYHSSNPSKGSYSNPQHVYSVSPPTTLSYHPSKKRQRVLTPSSTPPLTFAPQQPPALTIHRSRRISVHPASTLNNIQKSHVKKGKRQSLLKSTVLSILLWELQVLLLPTTQKRTFGSNNLIAVNYRQEFTYGTDSILEGPIKNSGVFVNLTMGKNIRFSMYRLTRRAPSLLRWLALEMCAQSYYLIIDNSDCREALQLRVWTLKIWFNIKTSL